MIVSPSIVRSRQASRMVGRCRITSLVVRRMPLRVGRLGALAREGPDVAGQPRLLLHDRASSSAASLRLRPIPAAWACSTLSTSGGIAQPAFGGGLAGGALGGWLGASRPCARTRAAPARPRAPRSRAPRGPRLWGAAASRCARRGPTSCHQCSSITQEAAGRARGVRARPCWLGAAACEGREGEGAGATLLREALGGLASQPAS